MKFFLKLLLLLMATSLVGGGLEARNPLAVFDITLIKATKTLKAPHAAAYSWYLNEERMDVTTDEIAIKKAGTYRVEMRDEFGQTRTRRITIAIDAAGDPVVVHLIGDSTVQNYGSYYYPRAGWGQVLQHFFDTAGVVINNQAVGGTSSKSFYNSFWPGVLASVDSGDFVLIGFGINDNNPSDTSRHTIASTTFKDYLTLYVQETQAAGAYPVIVSTVRRNAWENDSSVYNAYHGYPIASRELAATLGVPLIDLDARSKVLMENLRRPYCGPYWYMNLEPGEYPTSGAYSGGSGDNVHFQEMGAIEMARLVTEEIQALSADPNVSTLIPHLKPSYEVALNTVVDSSWDEYGGLITRTASYPEGINVTLKVKPEVGGEFVKWSSGSLDSLTNEKLIQFTMGGADTSYTAHFYYPPRLAIQSPLDGELFELGQEVVLDVFAHSVSDTHSVVIIYEGQNEVVRLDTAPYRDTLSTIGIGPGTHTYVAKAYDVSGNWMESAPITFEVDSGYPKITLLEPAGDSFYDLGDTIRIVADAYDSNGTLDSVRIFLDGAVIATLDTAPYSYEIINPAVGSYTLYATATDDDGLLTQTASVLLEVGPIATFQELEDGYCGIANDLGTIDNNHAGHTGMGFVNVDNAVGTAIDYTISFPDTGAYKFVFRYAATTARPGDLMINGKIVGSVPFPATTDWTDWGFSSIEYTLSDSTGDKPVSIIATGGAGLPNIDYLRVVSLTPVMKVEASAECLEQAELTSNEKTAGEIKPGFSVYPVPANDYLMIESTDGQPITDVAIYDLNGTLVKTAQHINLASYRFSCAPLRTGFYLVRAAAAKGTYFRKVVISR